MKKRSAIFVFALFAVLIFAAPPPDVPGEILTNETFFGHIMRNQTQQNSQTQTLDTLNRGENAAERSSRFTVSLADQIAADTAIIRYGKGALFVPRMTEQGNLEPTFHIYDQSENRVEIGETGRKIALSPGKYTLTFIDRTPFSLTQEFEIRQAEITPVLPTWGAVRIEVIDVNGIPFRGEYDLASLSPLAAVGRGYGRDLNLAEDLRVWFLPLGYYKVLGVGSALNAIDNFLTFKISQEGELIRFTVVQDTESKRILGGGTLLDDIVTASRVNSDWRHSLSIGASVDFNHYRDDYVDSLSNVTNFSVLIFDRLTFRRNRTEFINLVKFDLGMSVEDMDIKTIRTTNDEFRVNSLFTYRLFRRFGPYVRGEFISSLLERNADFGRELRNNQGAQHAFIIFDKVPEIIDDGSDFRIDKNATSFKMSPAFSPIQFQTGTGINAQLFQNHILEARFLSGIGVEFVRQWNSWRTVPERNLTFDSTSAVYRDIYNTNIQKITLEKNDGQRFEVGPEFILNYFLFLTKFLTLDGEMRVFMPFDRIAKPDFRSHTLFSLRLTQYLSVDYDYIFNLTRPEQEELQTRSHKHRVLARFSFAKR